MRWLRDLFIIPEHATEARWPARLASAAVAVGGVASLLSFSFLNLVYHWNFAGVWKYRGLFLTGWLTTLGLSLAALALSTAAGLVTALAWRSRLLPLRYAARLYVELIRGTPLLVQILVFFYVVADAFGLENRYVLGVLILSVFAGAYISEIIRAGLESVGESQRESARAIGLTRPQIYRYVVFPQALRQILPPLTGQFVSLVKDSSLLSIIAINELTLNAQQVNAYTVSPLEGYIPLALGYLILTLPLALWTRRLERKVAYAT